MLDGEASPDKLNAYAQCLHKFGAAAYLTGYGP